MSDRKTMTLEDFLGRWNRNLQLDKRTYGVKFCFAGAEGRGLREGLYRVGARNVLFSYFYLRTWLKKKSIQEVAEFIGKFDFVFLDSGAFTFNAAAINGKNVKMSMAEYAAEYHEILPKIHHLFAGCAEIDVGSEFSQQEMEDVRTELIDQGVANIVPVYQGQPLSELEEYGWFDKHPYIAVGSRIVEDKKERGKMIDLFKIGKDRGIVFHAFGVTTAENVLKSPYFSCDSSVGATSRVVVRDKKGEVHHSSIKELYDRIGETQRIANEGRAVAVDYETLTVVRSYEGDYRSVWLPLRSVVRHDTAKRRVRITISTGDQLEVTIDHSLYVFDGYGELKEVSPSHLSVGVKIAAVGKWFGKVCEAKIVGLEELEEKYVDVYDLEVPGPQRFIANGILAHNTTWKNGSKFGATMVFQNGRIRHYDKDHKSVRKKYKKRAEDVGIVWDDIEREVCDEVDLFNAVAWLQWSDYIRYNVRNCYWLTPEEVDLALDLKSKVFNAEGLIDRAKSIQRAEERRLTRSDAERDDRAHEPLHCDQCHMTGRCPRYKEGQVCGYDINISLNSKADLNKAIKNLLETEYGRVMNAALFEKLEGGILDKNVSTEMSVFLEMLHKVKSIFDTREEINISAKGPGGSGVISQMLASVLNVKGSGNNETQRAATREENELALNKRSGQTGINDIIDVEAKDVTKN